MDVPINYVAVLIAAIANMGLGFVWYGNLFGKQWMALSGMTKEKMQKTQKQGMSSSYLLSFGGSLIMAFVLAHALVFASSYLHMSGISAGLMSGFWNWLGFVMPVTLGMVLWDGKPWKLWFLHNGYNLVSLLFMGSILSLM